MGALRVFATIFVWTFTLYCVKYNGANFIIKMCVNLHINSNIHNEFPAPFVISNEHLYRKIFIAEKCIRTRIKDNHDIYVRDVGLLIIYDTFVIVCAIYLIILDL